MSKLISLSLLGESKVNKVRTQTNQLNNSVNGHSTIVQVNNQQPLKEKQANTATADLGNDKQLIKCNSQNGTITSSNQQNNSKALLNGIKKDLATKLVNSTVNSTVKTQQRNDNSIDSTSSNDTSSVASNETTVIEIKEANKLKNDDQQIKSCKIEKPNSKKCCNRWFKEAVLLATNFEDGKYVQSVIEAIRTSSKLCEWTRVQNCLDKK